MFILSKTYVRQFTFIYSSKHKFSLTTQSRKYIWTGFKTIRNKST